MFINIFNVPSAFIRGQKFFNSTVFSFWRTAEEKWEVVECRWTKYEYGATVEWWGRCKNEVLVETLVSMPLSTPQIIHGPDWDRLHASMPWIRQEQPEPWQGLIFNEGFGWWKFCSVDYHTLNRCVPFTVLVKSVVTTVFERITLGPQWVRINISLLLPRASVWKCNELIWWYD